MSGRGAREAAVQPPAQPSHRTNQVATSSTSRGLNFQAAIVAREVLMLFNATLRKTGLLVAALAGFLLLSGAAPVQAHDRNDDCYRRIHRAEEKLEREIYRHGYYSRQARHQRHELQEERERCYRHRDRDDWRDRDR
jgi:hypothetical protein